MHLGRLTDGLLCLYKIYCKRCNSNAFELDLARLKQELIAIYESLPREFQAYYRRKKLSDQDERIAALPEEIFGSLRENSRAALGAAAGIHRKMMKMQGHRQAVFELSLLFGVNMELSKYFFRKLARLEDDLYILEIIPPTGKRQLWPLLYESIVLGRRDSVAKNLLVVDDRFISKPHCRITRDANRVTIEDFNSRNGTLVNGAIIRGKISISPKDKISIGNTSIFCYSLKKENIVDTLETELSTIEPRKSLSVRLSLIATGIVLLTALIFTFFPAAREGTEKDRMAGKGLEQDKPTNATLESTDIENQETKDGLVEYLGERITPEEKYTREQVAKGLIKYRGKWLTPQQKREKEQLSKGLVKYRDLWLTPEEKYEREQLDKGMVKYQGQWVTPEEKRDREQLAGGRAKYRGQWLTPSQRRKKAREFVEKQLRYLRKSCKQATKQAQITDAYKEIAADKNTQILEDLQFAGKPPKKSRRCYVFPASLYRENENFTAVMEIPRLQKEITDMEIHFAAVIQKRIALKNRLQTSIKRRETLEHEIANIEDEIAMQGKLKLEIAKTAKLLHDKEQQWQRKREKIQQMLRQAENLARDLEKNRQERNSLERNSNISYMKRRLRNRESDMDRQRQRTREIQQDIHDVHRQLEKEINPEKKKRLQARLEELERQETESLRFEKSIHDDKESIQNRIDEAEKKFAKLDRSRRQLQDERDDLQRRQKSKQKSQKRLEETIAGLKGEISKKQAQIEKIRERLPKIKARIREIKEMQYALKDMEHKLDIEIVQHDETLSPLDRLYARRNSIMEAARKYQKWWNHIEKNKKTFSIGKDKVKHYRANTILALFILKYFPANSYRVKTDESYRNFAGIVWIYY